MGLASGEAGRHHEHMQSLLALATGALTLVGVLVGGWLESRKDKGNWVRDEQLKACSRLNDEYSVVYGALSLARRGSTPKLDWDAWNQALSAVSLICNASVVHSATVLDAR